MSSHQFTLGHLLYMAKKYGSPHEPISTIWIYLPLTQQSGSHSTQRLLLCDDPDGSFELCGSMLTLACAFGVFTGGLSMCHSLENRLCSTRHLPTPSWCRDLLSAVESEMVWGHTDGKPRHNKHDAYDAEEFAEETDTGKIISPLF